MSRRQRLVKEIMDSAKRQSLNENTIIILLTVTTDKALTKLHQLILAKEK